MKQSGAKSELGAEFCSSSDEMEQRDGLLEEKEEEERGRGELSEESHLWLPEAGDVERWITEALSLSPCGSARRLACATRFFFSRGEMTSPTAEEMFAGQVVVAGPCSRWEYA